MKKKAYVPIGNFRWLKPSAHVPEKSIMPVYKKLRIKDMLKCDGKYVRIDYMIENQPLELWNMIYKPKKGYNKISLENKAYKFLKSKIQELKPDWVDEVNRKREIIKSKKLNIKT